MNGFHDERKNNMNFSKNVNHALYQHPRECGDKVCGWQWKSYLVVTNNQCFPRPMSRLTSSNPPSTWRFCYYFYKVQESRKMPSGCIWALTICIQWGVVPHSSHPSAVYRKYTQSRVDWRLFQSQSWKHFSDVIGSEIYPLLKCSGLSWNFLFGLQFSWLEVLINRGHRAPYRKIQYIML